MSNQYHRIDKGGLPADAEQRALDAKIDRLRKRVKQLAQQFQSNDALCGILLGILDLLNDEL